VAIVDFKECIGYRTSKEWSVTTNQHMDKFFGDFPGLPIEYKPQEFFEDLLNKVKLEA